MLTRSHKPWMDIFYALNGDDILQKLHDFEDKFVFDCFTYSPHF